MLTGMRRCAALWAAMAVLAGGCSAEEGSRPLDGATVTVLAVWDGPERQRFEDVLDGFERRTGATVHYVSTAGEDVTDVLDARIAAGQTPEVALLPQPGLIERYARQGALQPLDAETVAAVDGRYAAVWRRLGTVAGRRYAVWFKAANKSLIWYHLGLFERAGVVPPTDLEDLVALAEQLAGSGVTPFSVAGGDAWTLTDWFENLYLRVAGPQRYDDLADRSLPWTDRSVTAALRLFARLLQPAHVAGGPTRALTTSFPDSVSAVLSTTPAAAMVFEGDFVAGFVDRSTGVELGVDGDVFAFPEPSRSRRLVVAGGDAAVLLRDSAAARAMLRYLASAEAAEIWVRQGGFISPNEDVSLAAYPDDMTRTIARSLLEAGDALRFDLSDLQPAAFGATTGAGMFAILRDVLADPAGAETAGQRLEAAARAAYGS